jgi:hypothetical protein
MKTLAEDLGEGRTGPYRRPGTPRGVARDPGSVTAPWLASPGEQVAGEQVAGEQAVTR